MSAFDGRSRESSFVVGRPTDPQTSVQGELIPYYGQIRQVGLDVQYTTEQLLYKMEAIYVSGARNLFAVEESYRSYILGAEHSAYGLFGSAASLTFLGGGITMIGKSVRPMCGRTICFLQDSYPSMMCQAPSLLQDCLKILTTITEH